jgi:aminopeptidase N
MLQTLLGRAVFRRGLTLYLGRHDGCAATCDDFLRAMADASGADLDQFSLWYSRAGTPRVTRHCQTALGPPICRGRHPL